MAKYKLTENGVFDTENKLSIPNAPGNRHWREYQEWLAEGNTPDPMHTLDELKTLKKQEINQWREQALKSVTVTYNSNTFDADQRSRENINGTVTAIQSGVPVSDPLGWRTADNVTVQLSHTDLINLSGLMFDNVNAAYSHSWDLKAQVDAATSESELDAITW